MANAGTLHHWIEALPERGRYVFTRAEAEAATDASVAAVKMTLYRLRRSGAIVSPRRDFHVVVPRPYRAAGSPPASWFLDDLMGHLGRPYYVSLLSAAALHGAGHQQPMALQVIADAAERPIQVGRVRIEFHFSGCTAEAATQAIQTETGQMRVATPETTAFDLVRYPAACGGWSNIATVLGELGEQMDPGALTAAAGRAGPRDVQRLGWLLELVEHFRLAEALEGTLAGHATTAAPLTAARPMEGAPLNRRWNLRINDTVEPDR